MNRTPRPRIALRELPPLVLALALAAVTAMGGAGCGLFKTATPEPPTTGDQIPPSFVLPESTLATLARAINKRNPSNYGLCFADTLLEQVGFHASFDPADINAFIQSGRIPPDDWTRDMELTFIPQFVTYNVNAPYDVYFFPDENRQDLDLGPAKKIQNRLYRVWAAGSPIAAGSAGFTFQRVGLAGDWKLTYWEDRKDTADVRTWGTARLNGR